MQYIVPAKTQALAASIGLEIRYEPTAGKWNVATANPFRLYSNLGFYAAFPTHAATKAYLGKRIAKGAAK